MPRTVTLYGAHGQVRTLACADNEPYVLRPDSGLWGLPTHAITSRPLIGAPGAVVEMVRAEPRTFPVPVLVDATSGLTVDQFLAGLGSILDPQRDIRLVFTREDGSRREITARYKSGGENLAINHEKHHKIVVPLVFWAAHPYWRSAEAIGEFAGTFEDGNQGAFNNLFVFNAGDVPVWPEITINGTGENFECANLSTGQVFRLTRALPVNETVRIDTDPRTFGVWLNDYAGFSTVIDPFSEFWPLLPGYNRLVFSADRWGDAPMGNWLIRYREEFTSP